MSRSTSISLPVRPILPLRPVRPVRPGAPALFTAAALLAGATTFPVHAAALDVSSLRPGQLLISEVMVNSAAVSDASGEWFEVHNRGAQAIDLAGLVVTSGGTRADEVFTVAGAYTLDAGAFAVFGRNGTSTRNGGFTADIVYGTALSFGNAADWLRIGRADGASLMEVAWDSPSAGRSLDVRSVHFDGTTEPPLLMESPLHLTYGLGGTGTPGAANVRDVRVYELPAALIATPTPEPATWAMLGAGLGVLALGTQRQRGRRQMRFTTAG
jgi:hypothetical protein